MKKPIGVLLYAALLSAPPLQAQNASESTADRQKQLLDMLLQQEREQAQPQVQQSQQQAQQAGQWPVPQVVQQLVQQALPQQQAQQQWQPQQVQQPQQPQQQWQAQPQPQQAQQQWQPQPQQAQQPQQQWQAEPPQTQQQWQQQQQAQQQWQQQQPQQQQPPPHPPPQWQPQQQPQQQSQQQWQTQQQQPQQQWQQQPQQQWQGQQPMNGQMAQQSSEAMLAAAISQFPVLRQGVQFERARDGFSINGQRYVDAQGTISAYSYDIPSGDFTYVLETEPGYYVVKAGRATTQNEPVVIANAQRGGGLWTVTTVTGRSFSGRRLIPSSRGFVIASDNMGSRYVAGKGATSFAAPADFSIAPLQNGDAVNTGYVLLERAPVPEGPSQVGNIVGGLIGAAKLIGPAAGLGTSENYAMLDVLKGSSGNAGGSKSAEADIAVGLVGAAQALGSSMGIGKKDDYALFNVSSGRIVSLNITLESKQAEVLSDCKLKNAMAAKCSRLESLDSIYAAGGKRNMEHYFWRIHWFNVPGRPILVAQEKGTKKVTATDLNSGKKVILFERMLGISDFAVTQEIDGKINATAKMGFSSESRQDVAALIDKLKNVAEDSDIN